MKMQMVIQLNNEGNAQDRNFLIFYGHKTSVRGQGESAGPFLGLPCCDMGGPPERVSYSPGVIDAFYSLSTLKTICAWRRAISYER